MIRVVHLIDDARTGGVTKVASDMSRSLGDGFDVQVMPVNAAWRLPGPISAEIVVVDFTLSWAKLPFLMMLRLAGRRRIVVVEHSYTASYERECVTARGRFRTMLRLGFRLADRVVAVSNGQAEWLRQAHLVSPERLVVIPQSLDLSALAKVPPAPSGRSPLRLGAYGRYVTQKGFDVLIAAMRLVPPEVATLRLAGYGPQEARLRQDMSDLPHVTIGPALNDAAAFLAEVDVVVVPSRWEAYGLVAQEARASGRPVIASRVDGLEEQVNDDLGLLVPANDPRSLAASIHALATRDLQAMAASARKSTHGLFEQKIAAWRALLVSLAAVGDQANVAAHQTQFENRHPLQIAKSPEMSTAACRGDHPTI